MRKINNPFRDLPGYNCFGCSPENPLGLHLEFREDAEYVISEWIPRPEYQGYANILHGGIQATLMDEIASWTIYVKQRTGGVTAAMRTKYRHPVLVNKGAITLKSRIKTAARRIVTVEVHLFDAEDKLCAESEVDYFILPEEQAREKLFYPGRDAF